VEPLELLPPPQALHKNVTGHTPSRMIRISQIDLSRQIVVLIFLLIISSFYSVVEDRSLV